MVMEEWRMSESVFHGVKNHYRPDDEAGRMGAMLHLSCWVAQQMGKGFKAEAKQWSLSEDVLQRAGLTEEAVQACIVSTQEALDALKKRLKTG